MAAIIPLIAVVADAVPPVVEVSVWCTVITVTGVGSVTVPCACAVTLSVVVALVVIIRSHAVVVVVPFLTDTAVVV